MTNKAIFIRELKNFRGKAVLVRFDPPVQHKDWLSEEVTPVEYGAISSANTIDHGFETLVFAATPDGEVEHWGGIAGGPGMNWAAALESIGYEPVDLRLDNSEVLQTLSRLSKWDVPLTDGHTWVEVSAEDRQQAWAKALGQGHPIDLDVSKVKKAE